MVGTKSVIYIYVSSPGWANIANGTEPIIIGHSEVDFAVERMLFWEDNADIGKLRQQRVDLKD